MKTKTTKVKNIRPAPKDCSLRQLFDFFWDHGIGNFLAIDGTAHSWTYDTLGYALEDVGYQVGKRSIQAWKSGERIPKIEACRALSLIAAGAGVNSKANLKIQRNWADALVFTRRDYINAKQKTKEKKGKNAPLAGTHPTGKTELSTSMPTPPLAKPISPQNKNKTFYIALVSISLFIIIFYGVHMVSKHSTTPIAKAENIVFCDGNGFSKASLTCETPITYFPSGIEKIYVSFDLVNSYDGQTFERRWYKNGEFFLNKHGFNDIAWDGWTYLLDNKANEDGDTAFTDAEYHLRIIIDDKVSTANFFIGKSK